MSNEATVRVSLSIRKVSDGIVLLDYSRTAGYQEDVTGTKGPSPGAIAVSTDGVAVDLSEITTPGWCWFHNQDGTNRVTVGIRDPDSGYFYPMLDLLPGMRYPVYLSQDLLEQYEGTGTGTGTVNNQLWIKAFTAACNVLVEVFEA